MVTDAVGALRFYVKSNKFPPAFNLVRSFSLLFWLQLAHYFSICEVFKYFGNCVLEMKITVLVPYTVLVPWADSPSSFAKDRSQIFLSGPLTRCLHSWATTDIWWVTVLSSLTCRNCAANAKFGTGIFLKLDLKLELFPRVSTLGGCNVRNLGGGTGTSGRMMCGTEG